jgi:hypothetical protein
LLKWEIVSGGRSSYIYVNSLSLSYISNNTLIIRPNAKINFSILNINIVILKYGKKFLIINLKLMLDPLIFISYLSIMFIFISCKRKENSKKH